MVIILGASFFIVIFVMSVIVILAVKESGTPKEAVLRHPNKDMVLAGSTKKDLEQVVKISKDWAKTYVREAFRGASEGDFTEARERVIEAAYPMQELLTSGRVIEIDNGTRCFILKSGFSMCKVEITEGSKEGQTCWVYKSCIEYEK